MLFMKSPIRHVCVLTAFLAHQRNMCVHRYVYKYIHTNVNINFCMNYNKQFLVYQNAKNKYRF